MEPIRTQGEESVILLPLRSAGLLLELECLQLSHSGKCPVHPHHLSMNDTNVYTTCNILYIGSDVTRLRMDSKAYHNHNCIQQKRNRVHQRYEHALGIKVLEIRKGPAKNKYTS